CHCARRWRAGAPAVAAAGAARGHGTGSGTSRLSAFESPSGAPWLDGWARGIPTSVRGRANGGQTPRVGTPTTPPLRWGRVTTSQLRYGFGANWNDFVATSLNEARIANAVQSLRDLLALDSLRGRTFLDIGCGSGLFSLAACRLEAERVISFDFDADSVRPRQWLR